MTSKDIGLRKYAIDEMSKFRNSGDLKNFIKTLDNEQILILCEWLSTWRDNGIYQFIVAGPSDWRVADAHISKIIVGKVNDKVNHLLEKHNFLLESIAQDKGICEHEEFASQSEFEWKTLIAQISGDMFILKDGIHRAVRAACDGQQEFKLLCY